MRRAARRKSDPADADFAALRRSAAPFVFASTNSHTRWIVGFISVAIVAALGTLVMLDREDIVMTGDAALAKATANEKGLEVLATDVGGKLTRLQEDVREIKQMLRDQSSGS